MVRDDLPAPLRAEACDDDILIGTIEPGDLPRCIDILMEAFYKDILTLAADEFRCPLALVLRFTPLASNAHMLAARRSWH